MRMPLLGERTLTRLRYGAETFVNGLPVAQVPTEDTITASLHGAPKSVLDRMPDGLDATRVATAVTYFELRTARDGVKPDVVRVPSGLDILAGDYEVQEVTINPAFVGFDVSYYAVMVRR